MNDEPYAVGPVVTLSASYGAGGSEVGPRLAQALEVPFVDRAIPTLVAELLALPLDDAIARDQVAPGTLDRMLQALAALGPMSGIDFRTELRDRGFAEATEQVIRQHADSTGGVILGRAGAVVLRNRPHTLHVRLTGPVERRIDQAMALEQVDRPTARRRVAENDGARDAYVRWFYSASSDDPSLYHLVVDSTAISLDACAEMITLAVRALQ